MEPSEKQIIAEIHTIIRQIYSDPLDRENLTVRHVRDLVEPKLGLDKGFLTQEQWKGKSKKIIKEYAEELIAQQEAEEDSVTIAIQVKPEIEKKPTPTPTPLKAAPVKEKAKRASQESKPPPRKRQKKEVTPSDEELSELSEPSPEESDESEFGEDSDAPKRKRNSKSKSKIPVKAQAKKRAVSDSDEEDDLSDGMEPSEDSSTKRKPQSQKKAPAKWQSKSKAKVESSDHEKEEDDSPKKPLPNKFPAKETPKKVPTSIIEPSPNEKVTSKKEVHRAQFKKAPSSNEDDNPKFNLAADASDSEMSAVIDATPKPKRKRRSKSDVQSEPKAKPPKSSIIKASRPKSSSGPKSTKDRTPDEAHIKNLQSQLKKCGVNKIWQFELKQYGDDNPQKIRHLQRLLKEIGMSGRFSEARAREIKEMRELQADLEAVKEGEKSWGLGGGRSASRVKGKSFRENSGSVDEDDDAEVVKKGGKEEDGSEDEGKKARSRSRSESEQPVARKPRARADLAFLDDEEESDS